MKIWGEIPKILGIYDKQKNTGRVEKTSGVTSKKDVVSISNQAKDFQTALKAVRELPDIRADKVNEISKKFESGSYNVSGGEVADRIVNSIIDKKA